MTHMSQSSLWQFGWCPTGNQHFKCDWPYYYGNSVKERSLWRNFLTLKYWADRDDKKNCECLWSVLAWLNSCWARGNSIQTVSRMVRTQRLQIHLKNENRKPIIMGKQVSRVSKWFHLLWPITRTWWESYTFVRLLTSSILTLKF